MFVGVSNSSCVYRCILDCSYTTTLSLITSKSWRGRVLWSLCIAGRAQLEAFSFAQRRSPVGVLLWWHQDSLWHVPERTEGGRWVSRTQWTNRLVRSRHGLFTRHARVYLMRLCWCTGNGPCLGFRKPGEPYQWISYTEVCGSLVIITIYNENTSIQ